MNKFLRSVLVLSISSVIASLPVYAATYQVIDTGINSSDKYTTAQKQNADGVMTILGSQGYNFPVQFDLLTENDFTAIEQMALLGYKSNTLLGNIEDSTALRAGTPTANDFTWVIKYLQSKVKDSLYQKVGSSSVLINDSSGISEVNIFDKSLADGRLSRSTDEMVYGITNGSWIYGASSAPYLPSDFTGSDGVTVKHWQRNFDVRGFVTLDNGNTIKSVIPPESRFGGESGVLDINDNHVGVGYVSTSIKKSVLDFINNTSGGCADPKILAKMSLEVCVWQQKQLQRDGIYNIQATKFTFDAQGNVIASESLGNLVTPNVDDTRVFKSYAQAINNHGVAVGYANGWAKGELTNPKANEARSTYAVMFKGGKAISFTKTPLTEVNSRAYDINDAGIAVGHAVKSINGSARSKFYYVDTNNPDLTMVFPTDFFNGSSSTARAINEQGLIVGDGEVETQNDTSGNPRRRHGFLYDMNADKFTDLNKFLTCNSQYTIIEARDINDKNEITATAIVKQPRRNSYGEVENDTNGTPLTEDVVRAVTLKPIAGKIEDCSKVVAKIKRKGASINFLTLFLLMPFAFRRKFFKS